jgi:hypothetical protein
MDMATTVLLVGVRPDLLDTVKKELQTPGAGFLAGTGVADAQAVFRQADIDHVIIGGAWTWKPGPPWSGPYSSPATGPPCT